MRLFFMWAGWPIRIIFGALILVFGSVFHLLGGLLGITSTYDVNRFFGNTFTWIRGDNIH